MFCFWRQSSWWVLLVALACARAALTVQGANLIQPPSSAVKTAANSGVVQPAPTTDSVTAAPGTIGPSSNAPSPGRVPDAASGKEQGDGSVETNEMQRKRPWPINEKYPYAVLYGPTCGGSIISPTWVITAAHCTLFTNGLYVLAGTNNTRDGSGVRVRVKRRVIHPLFSVGPYWLDAEDFGIKQVAARYDFLLVELVTPLKLDGRRLAAAGLNFGLGIPVGLDVGYAGFGAENFMETMREDMHVMNLQTVKDEVCARRLQEFNSEDMLCAKGVPPRYDSACNGDSGSGLVTHDGQLLGVTSWVEEDALNCRPGALVVFSRVARVRSWITKVTGL